MRRSPVQVRSPAPTENPSEATSGGFFIPTHPCVRWHASGILTYADSRKRRPIRAPIAQGIEHRPPEPGAEVRILLGAPLVAPLHGEGLFFCPAPLKGVAVAVGLQEWLAQFTQVLHPLNLAVMSFIEAIFLPIPPDAMLIPMVLLEPARALQYALLTTVASVAGAGVGYTVGFRGGRPLLARFAKGPTVGRIESMFQRYEFWAIVIAGFLPLPYKLFALSSGVFNLDRKRFLAASLLGRGARFTLVALIVRRYGAGLAEAIIRSSGWFTGGLAVLVVGAGIVWWRRSRSGRAQTGEGADGGPLPKGESR